MIDPLDRICKVCGCCDPSPCVYVDGGGVTRTCAWVEDDLCSLCAIAADPEPLLFDASGAPLIFK